MEIESQINTAIQTDSADSSPERRLPGDLVIWIFIFAELTVFGIFFVAFAFTRSSHIELFNTSQLTLDRGLGALNTLVLLTSSYFVVRAVDAIKQGMKYFCVGWLLAAQTMGLIFVVVKVIEYQAKFAVGIDIDTNTFYMFYFLLTGFHGMHVLLGMVILTAVALKAYRGGYSTTEHTGVETGASYWHMVDLVWLIVFPLIYLIH